MDYEVKNFETDVIEQSYKIPVLVDFWAEWCAPCKILGPVLEKVAEKYKDKVILAKLDTDSNQDIAMKYGIRGIPNVKLFVDGEVKNEFTGALPENMIEQFLQKELPGKYKTQLETAKKLLAEGNSSEAKLLLESIYESEPDDEEIKLMLAKTIVFEDYKKAAKLVENVDGSPENYEISESIQTLAELFEKLNSPDILPDDNVKDLYLSAIKKTASGKFDEALSEFIDLIKENKAYDDEGARKACIAIFKYLGEENEITLRHRRDFGSALYV